MFVHNVFATADDQPIFHFLVQYAITFLDKPLDELKGNFLTDWTNFVMMIIIKHALHSWDRFVYVGEQNHSDLLLFIFETACNCIISKNIVDPLGNPILIDIHESLLVL